MNWQQAVEKTVTGLGYELVDCELALQGLLCVYIDRIPGRVYGDAALAPVEGAAVVLDGAPPAIEQSEVDALDPVSHAVAGGVTVEDCERVTRQLLYVLEVEGANYARLEVSSPGLDRPLRRAGDFERFDGSQVDVTLKMTFQGRKRYRGLLRAAPNADRYELVFGDDKAEQVLGFTLAEVREARLAPVLEFKGRQRGPKKAVGPVAGPARRARGNAKAKQHGPESGGHEE